MTVFIDSFCKCTIPEIYKLLPDKTTLVLTGNKYGISAQLEKYCKEKNIPILVINPNDENNVTDMLVYIDFLASLSNDLYFITEENSLEANIYFNQAKIRKKTTHLIYNY